jgi:hypothetical protein
MSHAEERMSDAQDGPPQRPETTTTDDDSDGGTPAGQGSVLPPTLLVPGDRKTRNVELLLTEAKLAAEGKEIENPAKPAPPAQSRDGFIKDAIERIHEAGLEPAWRVCPREDDA